MDGGCGEIRVRRVAFGRPIRDFGQIQRHIADSYAQWRAARSYVYDFARRMDLNQAGNRVDSDGVNCGSLASSSATTPATCGDAIDVPLITL